MDGRIGQRAVLLLLVGGGAVYAAFENPPFGTALLASAGVVTLPHLLMTDR